MMDEDRSTARGTMQVRPAGPMLPAQIYERVVEEGQHRLSTTLPQTIARALTAGFTIVFGIAALGIVLRSPARSRRGRC